MELVYCDQAIIEGPHPVAIKSKAEGCMSADKHHDVAVKKCAHRINLTTIFAGRVAEIPLRLHGPILAKTMNEDSLKQVAAVITAKKVSMSVDEARDLAKRALRFKQERGKLPSITSQDAWERRMAEGVAYLARMKAEAAHG